jgi:anti-sigma B factor antagonist
MKEFSVDVQRVKDVSIVGISGSVDSTAASALDATFEELLDDKHTTIVVDLSDTDFISSSGIGVLLSTVSLLRQREGDLVLMNPPKIVDDLLEIMNIRDYFRSIDDLDELSSAAS